MERPTVQASSREATGTGPNRRLRASGRIPGVVYGQGKPSRALAVDPHVIVHHLHGPYGRNTILSLAVEGEEASRMVIVRDYQVHPWKRRIQHVDFWEITPETELVVTVPFRRVGKSQAEAVGGRIQMLRDEVIVRCLPDHIPAVIEYDVTGLTEEDEAVAVSKVPMPAGVEAVFKQDYNVIRVKSAKAEAAAAAAEAAAAAAAATAGEAAPAAEAAEPAEKEG